MVFGGVKGRLERRRGGLKDGQRVEEKDKKTLTAMIKKGFYLSTVMRYFHCLKMRIDISRDPTSAHLCRG
jgi:hypothetical protein